MPLLLQTSNALFTNEVIKTYNFNFCTFFCQIIKFNQVFVHLIFRMTIPNGLHQVPEPLQSCLSWVTGMLFRMFSSGKQGMRGKSGQMPPLLDLLAAFFVVKQQRNHRGTVLEKPKNDPPPEHWMPQQPHESHHEWRLVERCAQLAVGMYTYPTYLILPSRDWFRASFTIY